MLLDLLATLAAAAAVVVATLGAVLVLPWTDDDVAEVGLAARRLGTLLGAALRPALPPPGGRPRLP